MSLITINNLIFFEGYFIQVYKPDSEPTTMNGGLQSPIIKATTESMCFRFYYYIHGLNAHKLELFLVNIANNAEPMIWSRQYPAGDMWHLYMINIPPQTSLFRVCSYARHK